MGVIESAPLGAPQHESDPVTEIRKRSKRTEKQQLAHQSNVRNKTQSIKKNNSLARTQEANDVCDFPVIKSNVSRDVSVCDNAPSNAECKRAEQLRSLQKFKVENSRRYSDLHVCARALLAHAYRRNSTPTVRDVNMAKSDNGVHGRDECKAPKNTPCHPDLNTCCQNVATFLAEAVSRNSSSGYSRRPVPSAEYIYSYMRFLFAILQLEPEVCVYADIYFRRLLSNANGTLKIHSGNWHRILVGSYLLASKYVDDLSMDNRDFSTALTGCSVQFINKLEAKFLQMLNWQIHVPISEYTKRYFELARKQDNERNWDSEIEKVKPHFTVF